MATGVSWIYLPDAPTYLIPAYPGSISIAAWAVLAEPIAGVVSVLYVRAVAWTDHHRPAKRWRLVAPVSALTLLGAVSIVFPSADAGPVPPSNWSAGVKVPYWPVGTRCDGRSAGRRQRR